MAASNVSSTPSFSKAEHSWYERAPTCCAIAWPCEFSDQRWTIRSFCTVSQSKPRSFQKLGEKTHLLLRHIPRPSRRSVHHRLVPQVSLTPDEQHGDVGPAQFADFLDPLDRDVVERVGRVERERDQDDVRLGVTEWPEALATSTGLKLTVSETCAHTEASADASEIPRPTASDSKLNGRPTHLVLFLTSAERSKPVSIESVSDHL